MTEDKKETWFVVYWRFFVFFFWYPVRFQGCLLVFCTFACVGLIVVVFAALGLLPLYGDWLILPIIPVVFLFYAIALKHTEFR